MTDEFLQWLRAQLDDDERVAQAATPGPWHAQDGGVVAEDDEQWPVAETESGRDREDRVHIARQDPAQVLDDVAAKRDLIAAYERMRDDAVESEDRQAATWALALASAVRRVGAAYQRRPGYRDDWRQ